MRKEDDFNDILRAKFTERHIPPSGEDWRKMRRMIDNSRKRKIRIVWGIVSFTWLLLGIGVFELSSMHNPSKHIVAPVNTGSIPLVENSPSVRKNDNVEQSVTASSVEKKTKTIAKENVHSSPTSIANNNIGKTFNTPISKSIKKESKIIQEVAAITPAETYKASSTHEKDLPAVSERSNERSSEVKLADNLSTVKPVTAINNTVLSSPVTKDEDAKMQSADWATNENTKTDNVEKNQSALSEIPNTTSAQPKSDSSIKKSDNSSAQLSLQSAAPLPPLRDTTPSKNIFSIEAGAGYSLGWKYTDTIQGRSINPTIGIGYTRIISSKFALKTGLQLGTLGNMSASPFIIKHVSYDFGYNANDTSVITKWLYYLTIPIQLEYKVGEKNAVGVGGTISYLIIGSGQIDAYTMSGNSASGNNNENSQFMSVKGYNRWNSSVFLLYKRTLFKNFSAYLIPYFGLMDIKNNSFFGQNKLERDSGVKLLLSYTIL